MNNLILTYRYTTITPNGTQSSPENSLGGFLSSNNIYTATTATRRVSRTAEIIPVTTLSSATSGLAQLGFEVVNYTGTDTTNVQLLNVERGQVPNASPIGFPHGITPYNPTVRYLDVSSLFDPNFDNLHKQYRCIGIRNAFTEDAEYLTVILIQDNLSDIVIDLGIEVPAHDYRTGTITTATSNLIFIDSNLAGLFADNYFANSALTMTSGAASGTTVLISSFDGDTGTFVLASSPGTLAFTDSYEISPAPSQTVVNHLTAPSTANGLFFGFLGNGGAANIGHGSIRENGEVFRPNDVFYLWIERTLPENVRSRANTASVILFSYTPPGS